METGYKVSEIMVRDIISVDSGTTILNCAKKMADNGVGCLIIQEKNNLLGIVTEQDLARKALAMGISPNNPVSNIMSRNIKYIEPEKDIQDAMQLMGNNEIKHLPVVSGGKLVGLVTSKDIIQIQPGLIDLLSFKSSMRKEEE
jgi:signal-transduction protein with cAMP-binding, CBS, and nucleotidyltransferase domain